MNMRRPIVFLLIFAALSHLHCRPSSGPELALEEYIRAITDRRCADAFDHLSERTQYYLKLVIEKQRQNDGSVTIEDYYCNVLAYEDCKLGDMTTEDTTAHLARVSMPCGRTQDGILPGTTSPFLKYEPRSTELVLENGKWRVVNSLVIRIGEIREQELRLREAYLQQREQNLAKPRVTKQN